MNTVPSVHLFLRVIYIKCLAYYTNKEHLSNQRVFFDVHQMNFNVRLVCLLAPWPLAGSSDKPKPKPIRIAQIVEAKNSIQFKCIW